MNIKHLLLLAVFFLPLGCGQIRKTTTKRSAEEMVHVSAAAQRSVARMDFGKFKGKKVWVNGEYLKSIDRGFVLSCVHEQVVAAGMKRVKGRKNADIVLEVRCAALGTYDYHLTVGVPDLMAHNPAKEPVQSFDELPILFEFGYSLHEGWALIQAFAYERETGAFVFGSRDAYGRSFRGFFNDIEEPRGIVQGLTDDAK
jgi:hypothetical protein